ncbi:hypothetical protein C8F01DRAFT_1272763 [Mycena amicta]|nr:hypothetical protein C8F01DRAFT_1272763 [Mycena amicta]
MSTPPPQRDSPMTVILKALQNAEYTPNTIRASLETSATAPQVLELLRAQRRVPRPPQSLGRPPNQPGPTATGSGMGSVSGRGSGTSRPSASFVLIEDVDAAFNKRVQTTADGYQSSITFSGFLNALDGVASGEERIVFMTTNHVEKLDPALIRPGRVDFMALVDNAAPLQARTLFENFYGGADLAAAELVDLAHQVEEMVKTKQENGQRVSMAALQGHFIRNPATEAVLSLRELFPA